jgi:hypothetical protein
MLVILISFIIFAFAFTIESYDSVYAEISLNTNAYLTLLLLYALFCIIVIWIIYVIKTQVRCAISSLKMTNYYDSHKGVVHGLVAGAGLGIL